MTGSLKFKGSLKCSALEIAVERGRSENVLSKPLKNWKEQVNSQEPNCDWKDKKKLQMTSYNTLSCKPLKTL